MNKPTSPILLRSAPSCRARAMRPAQTLSPEERQIADYAIAHVEDAILHCSKSSTSTARRRTSKA